MARHDFLFLYFIFFQNVAEDALGQVVQGDDALRAAVFVHYDAELVLVLLEELQYLLGIQALRDEQGRAGNAAQVERLVAAQHDDDVLHRHHTYHLVLAVFHQQVFAEVLFADDAQHVLAAVVGVHHNDVPAVGHQVVGALVREAEHVAQHLRFVLVYDALLRTLVQNHFQFFLGHLAFRAFFQANQFVDQLGGGAEQEDEGVGDVFDGNHQRAEPRGPLLRVTQGDGFGDQFAHDERQIGDEHDYRRYSQCMGVGSQPRNQQE